MQWNPLCVEFIRSLRGGDSACQFLPETLTSLKVGTTVRWSWLAAAASQGLSGCAAGFQRAQVSVMESGRLRSGRGPRCPASLGCRHSGWCRIGNGMGGRVDGHGADRDAGGSQTGPAENVVAPQVLPDRPWLPLRPLLAPLSPADAPAGSPEVPHSLSRAPGTRVASGQRSGRAVPPRCSRAVVSLPLCRLASHMPHLQQNARPPCPSPTQVTQTHVH